MKKLFDDMSKEVEKTVKSYKTDFYKHDQGTLTKRGLGNYVWLLRKCGTELYPVNNTLAKGTYCNIAAHFHIEQDSIKKAFFIKGNSLQRIPVKKFESWLKENEEEYERVKIEIEEEEKEIPKIKIDEHNGLYNAIVRLFGEKEFKVLEYCF